ncbi:hypothetical protein CEXT_124281 [Caerostris extrusa]|uniref:Uncharacterized protein n=1 Tax=Caerostris extrusa TaxID=172846 RepID=A0AAV4M8U1_CAEEX|nr:hypothetical protein CEXT_124281 [Caerostris extrusa]
MSDIYPRSEINELAENEASPEILSNIAEGFQSDLSSERLLDVQSSLSAIDSVNSNSEKITCLRETAYSLENNNHFEDECGNTISGRHQSVDNRALNASDRQSYSKIVHGATNENKAISQSSHYRNTDDPLDSDSFKILVIIRKRIAQTY